MDFSLSDNHKMIERTVYDFARKTIMPIIKEHDRNHTFPRELLPQMASLGFLGICLPVRYGGAGLDYLSLAILSEGLEYADEKTAPQAAPSGNGSPPAQGGAQPARGDLRERIRALQTRASRLSTAR